MKKLTLILPLVILFGSCEEKNEDIVQQANHDGAVEIVASSQHLNTNQDIIKVERIVWNKGQQSVHLVSADTVASLGETSQEGEDENGNTKNLSVPKDYEFYITVK